MCRMLVVSRSYQLLLAVFCLYTMVLFYLDSYLFESALLIETWFKTKMDQNEHKAKLFSFDKSRLLDNNSKSMPLILSWNPSFGAVNGVREVCGCHHSYDRSTASYADAIVFHFAENRNSPTWLPWKHRNPNQRWVWMCMEPPWNVRNVFQKRLTPLNGVFNWTMTYRTDSDVLASYRINYEPVASIDDLLARKSNSSLFAAWVVSNCHAKKRNDFMEEIQRYISVDVFGKCSGRECGDCHYKTLSRYKFYFALENSQCKDYITEKFWYRGLGGGAVPVVMGAARSDYELVAPPNSFIHVDDFGSTKELADYLLLLGDNVELYSKYLAWRTDRTWKERSEIKARDARAIALKESIESGGANGLCALCHKLLKWPNGPTQSADHLDQWWFGKGYSPHGQHLPICKSDSSASGFPLGWAVTLGYSSLFFLILTCAFCCSRRYPKASRCSIFRRLA